MRMIDVLTEEAFEQVVREFLEMHLEIAPEAEIRQACEVLIDYVKVQ